MTGIVTLSRRVERYARRSSTAVRLQDLYKVGRGDLKARLRFARFLHQEVPVRNAQLCKELCLLPFGLAESQGVSRVISVFSSYVDMLADSPEPRTAEDYQAFTELLRKVLEDRAGVLKALGQGVLEMREAKGPDVYEGIRSEMDFILDRFFMKRLGLRFLLEHHIQAAEAKPGMSGIIHTHVNTREILLECAAEARKSCLAKYGCAPEVEVIGDGTADGQDEATLANPDLSTNRQFTYVPIHLRYSCSVLLQNACYAVAERGRPQSLENGIADVSLPPVQATFAYGQDEVTVRVSDEGGGVSQDDIQYAWSYFSAPGASPHGFGRGHRHSTPLGVHNEIMKAGLPLARLHARYYGGDLVLKPIQGLGTDAYLVLNRLGHNCENLPHGVRVSPAMSDSSAGGQNSVSLDSLGSLTAFEASFLKRRLKEFRILRQAEMAQLSSLASP